MTTKEQIYQLARDNLIIHSVLTMHEEGISWEHALSVMVIHLAKMNEQLIRDMRRLMDEGGATIVIQTTDKERDDLVLSLEKAKEG